MSDSLEDLARTMRSIDTTLKELAAFLAMGKKGIANETHALALLIELGPDIAAIADRIGVHRSTLYRWPKFMEQVDRVRRAGVSASG